MLYFESTKLESDPEKTNQLIKYDIKMHQKLALNNLFVFTKIHVANKGLWAYPARSFFLFAHNQPLSDEQL